MEIDVEDVLLEAYFDLLGSIGILQRVECVLKLNCKGSPQRKKMRILRHWTKRWGGTNFKTLFLLHKKLGLISKVGGCQTQFHIFIVSF